MVLVINLNFDKFRQKTFFFIPNQSNSQNKTIQWMVYHVKDDSNLVSDYLSITNDMREHFGMNTILFMQVGKFYEIYDINKDDSIQLQVCENMLNLTVTKTNRQCHGQYVYMCGVPSSN